MRIRLQSHLRDFFLERTSKKWTFGSTKLRHSFTESSLRVNESAFIMTVCHSLFEIK